MNLILKLTKVKIFAKSKISMVDLFKAVELVNTYIEIN